MSSKLSGKQGKTSLDAVTLMYRKSQKHINLVNAVITINVSLTNLKLLVMKKAYFHVALRNTIHTIQLASSLSLKQIFPFIFSLIIF